MSRYLQGLAVVAVLIAAGTEALPREVAGYGFGLLVAHWITGALRGVRDALVNLAAAAVNPAVPYSPDWDTRPHKPIFAEPGFEDETVERFEYRLAHYDVVRDAWVLDQAKRMVTSSR